MTLNAFIISISLIIALIAWAPALNRAWNRFNVPRQLWLAGEYQGMTKVGHVIWALLGVFHTRELALAACTKKNHFVTVLQLDQPLPEKAEDLPQAEYPLIKEAV